MTNHSDQQQWQSQALYDQVSHINLDKTSKSLYFQQDYYPL